MCLEEIIKLWKENYILLFFLNILLTNLFKLFPVSFKVLLAEEKSSKQAPRQE